MGRHVKHKQNKDYIIKGTKVREVAKIYKKQVSESFLEAFDILVKDILFIIIDPNYNKKNRLTDKDVEKARYVVKRIKQAMSEPTEDIPVELKFSPEEWEKNVS